MDDPQPQERAKTVAGGWRAIKTKTIVFLERAISNKTVLFVWICV